jgi:integrase/recombinase XerD
MASGASDEASDLQRATLEDWLNAQTSQNTRAAYRSDLESFGSWCAREGAIPLTATTDAIVAFQAARETAGDSPATLRRRWSALSSFYDYAVERDVVLANPVVGVSRPKVQSGDPSLTVRLTNEAVATCRAVAAALDPRLEALVALVVSDGLKVNEALALDIADVSGRPRATSITVRRRGAVRKVLLEHASALAVHRCVGGRRSGPVFVSERSSQSTLPSRLTRFGADHLIRQLRTDDATEQVTANALRRFHISTREASGLALEEVRDGAGLADVRGVRRFVDRS